MLMIKLLNETLMRTCQENFANLQTEHKQLLLCACLCSLFQNAPHVLWVITVLLLQKMQASRRSVIQYKWPRLGAGEKRTPDIK